MRTTRFLGSASLAMAFAIAAPAYAQTTTEVAPGSVTAADESCIDDNGNGVCDGDEGAIVVTGSRIARPNLTSGVPIATVQGEALVESGRVSIGDTLNELPQLRSTLGQQNSTRFLGTAGLNLLDLRGLGPSRTLVLLNGRRHVGSDILYNGVSPDTNTFPSDLLERVDVVTGANSAVYGSDALAGVVNFILKRNYEGIQVRGQAGISRYNDAGSYFISGTAGQNFADGRGNIAINLEYARQNDYYGGQRPFIRTTSGFRTVDRDPAGTPNGSDGVPDTIFFRDLRSATYSNTGLIRFGTVGSNVSVGSPLVNGGRDTLGGYYTLPYVFARDGTLIPVTGLRVGLAGSDSFIGGNGENFATGNQIQLSPELDRYSANVIGRFEFSPAFEVFAEGKYSRTDVYGSGGSGPAFISGTTLGDIREQYRLDNPFLTDSARITITNLLRANGTNVTPATRFRVFESFADLGARNEEFKRETWRSVLGVRGTFNTDWRYELSANYGEFTERNRIGGNLNVQRFLLANDAVRDPATGNIVCRSQIDPAARIPYNGDTDSARAAALLAADVAACVPVNVFGGNFTDAQRAYLLQDTEARGKITQFDVTGFVSGDLGGLFELPGGPVAFSVGAEYRRETNFYVQDPIVEAGYTFYNSIPTFTSPAFEVKEAFGEIRIPLLANLPLAQELTISGAGRVSDYTFGGTVYSYNGIVEWSPFSALKLRAAYGRGVRAPNLGELFTPFGQNYAPGFTDPCSARFISLGTANRAANCAAAGIPTSYDFAYSQSLEFRSGGNQLLTPETSDSWTFGGVFRPTEWIPGFSLSVDYFDITVNNAISGLSAQAIVNQCYDQPSLDNQFCALFQRAGASGGPNGEAPYQIIEGSLVSGGINFAGFRRRGVDVELAYARDIPGLGRFATRALYTRTLQNDSFTNPTNPEFITRSLKALGDPEDEFLWNSTLKMGRVTLGYDLRFVGEQLNVGYTSIFELNGQPAQNLDASETLYYPAVFYHNVRLGLDVTEKLNMYVGVNNLTDVDPPLGSSGIGAGSGIYDNRGRYVYLGFRANF